MFIKLFSCKAFFYVEQLYFSEDKYTHVMYLVLKDFCNFAAI